jgi:hypothetical protein
MRRAFVGACLLAFAILTMRAPLPAQEAKSQAEKSEKTEPAKKEKLIAIGAFGGKILKVDDDGKAFLLRVYGQTPELKFTPGNPAAC